MPQYLSPGVYVEAVPPVAPLIAGVATSTAGFLGAARYVRMPARPGEFRKESDGSLVLDSTGNPIPLLYELAKPGVPQRVTSWDAFKTRFGDVQPGNRELAHAVFGFFNNGGTVCWVVRVDSPALPEDLTSVLETFAQIEEVAIIAAPGATLSLQHEALVAHCAGTKDRIAILDSASATPNAGRPTIDTVSRSEHASYAAIYYPWISVRDPASDATQTVPPSGHIAGIYARTDATQGVFRAPANEEIYGALGVAGEVSLSELDELNAAGVNVLRSLDGVIKVWGARTLADENTSVFRYVSSRRYFNYLRDSIDQSTQFVAFEPNGPALWQRIRRALNTFLFDQWQAGALFGETPKQAFYVKCDAETNPPEVRALGAVVTEIGVAIVRPAEFVVLRTKQETAS